VADKEQDLQELALIMAELLLTMAAVAAVLSQAVLVALDSEA
jgi:hypothetical protein